MPRTETCGALFFIGVERGATVCNPCDGECVWLFILVFEERESLLFLNGNGALASSS